MRQAAPDRYIAGTDAASTDVLSLRTMKIISVTTIFIVIFTLIASIPNIFAQQQGGSATSGPANGGPATGPADRM